MIQACDFGKVAVLMGGNSAEREISLKSGKAAFSALLRKGIEAHALDTASIDILRVLREGRYSRVLILLHGRGGEDGVIQGALESLEIPYTGSGVLGSALSMDKLLTKYVWHGAGLPTPAFKRLDDQTDFEQVVATLGLPLMVKPAREGSSIGITKVTELKQLNRAWEIAAHYDTSVFAERCIQGPEYTAAILGNESLPLIRLATPRAFYDYEAKYRTDSTRYFIPCGLGQVQEQNLQQLALLAFETMGCSGWGRVDFLRDQHGDPWLIEANTIPGTTDHSLLPMAAQAKGLEFDDLIWHILSSSF